MKKLLYTTLLFISSFTAFGQHVNDYFPPGLVVQPQILPFSLYLSDTVKRQIFYNDGYGHSSRLVLWQNLRDTLSHYAPSTGVVKYTDTVAMLFPYANQYKTNIFRLSQTFNAPTLLKYQSSTPSTPPTGYGTFYMDNVGRITWIKSDGFLRQLSFPYAGSQVVTFERKAAYTAADSVDVAAKQNKLLFNVVDYGADPTGLTNSQTAVQNCINAADLVKGEVAFPAGHYNLTGGIHIDSAINIQGLSGNTSVNVSNTFNSGGSILYTTSATETFITCNINGIVIRDITIQNKATTTPTAGYGLYMGNAGSFRIQNVNFNRFYTDVFIQGGVGWILSNSYIINPISRGIWINSPSTPDFGDYNMTDDYFAIGNNATGLYVQNSGGLKMKGHKFGTYAGGTKLMGIGIDMFITPGTSQAQITGGSFDGYNKYAIRIRKASGGSFNAPIITNNYFSPDTTITGNSIYMTGVNTVIVNDNLFAEVGVQANPTIRIDTAVQVTILGNQFYNSTANHTRLSMTGCIGVIDTLTTPASSSFIYNTTTQEAGKNINIGGAAVIGTSLSVGSVVPVTKTTANFFLPSSTIGTRNGGFKLHAGTGLDTDPVLAFGYNSTGTGTFYLQTTSTAGNQNLELNPSGGTVTVFNNNPSGIARFELGPGNTARYPLLIPAGAYMTSTPTAGGFAFTADDPAFTITTGAAIKKFALQDGTLTSGFVPTATTNGRLINSTASTTQLQYLSSATGTTGTTSTNLVFSTSPTLVTPVLGAATATSLFTGNSTTMPDFSGTAFTPKIQSIITSGVAGVMAFTNDGSNSLRSGLVNDGPNNVFGFNATFSTTTPTFKINVGSTNWMTMNGSALSFAALSTNGSVQTTGGTGAFSVIANTGTGNNVLATSPTLTSPQLNTPLLNTSSTVGYAWIATNTVGAGAWTALGSIVPTLITGTPTIVAGTGAGTSPTVSVTTNGKQLQVTVTTGTLPTGTNATIATVTLPNALSYTPYPVFSSASALTSLLNGASMIYMTSTGSANVTITSGTTGLTAATTYVWNIGL